MAISSKKLYVHVYACTSWLSFLHVSIVKSNGSTSCFVELPVICRAFDKFQLPICNLWFDSAGNLTRASQTQSDALPL